MEDIHPFSPQVASLYQRWLGIGSNHVKLHSRFCFKNNARVWRSPSTTWGQAIQCPKEKGQSLVYKTLQYTENYPPPSPPTRFFHRKQNKNQIFIFWAYKKISNLPSNFYHKYLVRTARPDWWYFDIFHVNLFCFFKISPHNYFFSSEKKQPKS